MARFGSALAIAGGLAIGVLAAVPAQAAIISTFTNTALSATPLAVQLGGGVGSILFTAATTGYGPGVAIATSGNAQVTTIFGSVAEYGGGTVFDGTATYAAVPSPTVLTYSAADDFVGFSYIGSDGTHLGYAEVFGPTLIGYGVSNVANSNVTASPVPEPTTIALLLGGVAGLGLTRRRTNGAATA